MLLSLINPQRIITALSSCTDCSVYFKLMSRPDFLLSESFLQLSLICFLCQCLQFFFCFLFWIHQLTLACSWLEIVEYYVVQIFAISPKNLVEIKTELTCPIRPKAQLQRKAAAQLSTNIILFAPPWLTCL